MLADNNSQDTLSKVVQDADIMPYLAPGLQSDCYTLSNYDPDLRQKHDPRPNYDLEQECTSSACAEKSAKLAKLTLQLEEYKKKLARSYNTGYKRIRREISLLKDELLRQKALTNYWKQLALARMGSL